jgi:1-deoxy-D-xylulose-5-phosphate synthase
MVVMAPADEAECRQMLSTAYRWIAPPVRYPRGSGTGAIRRHNSTPCPSARAKFAARARASRCSPSAACWPALAAGDELDATVANMRFVKPIDADLIVELAGNHSLLVTLEETP